MTLQAMLDAAEYIYQDVRLRTLPVGVGFFAQPADLPEGLRRPASDLKKRITTCQAVTFARLYGWGMGLAAEDLVCVPSALTLGVTRAEDDRRELAELYTKVQWCRDQASAQSEIAQMSFLPKGRAQALAIAPIKKAMFVPEVAVIYANSAQVMRLIQAWCFETGELIHSRFGGKVECNEYLLAPLMEDKATVVIPGMGDRIFSMTQDDELVMALPAAGLPMLAQGLRDAGRAVGARYPITFYQNYEPSFPPAYKKAGKKIGLFD